MHSRNDEMFGIYITPNILKVMAYFVSHHKTLYAKIMQRKSYSYLEDKI